MKRPFFLLTLLFFVACTPTTPEPPLSALPPESPTAVTTQDSSYVSTTKRVTLILQSHTHLLSSNQLQGIRAVTVKTQNLPFISNSALIQSISLVSSANK